MISPKISLSFFVSFCSKKSFYHTETTVRIPKNLFNKEWRKKFSHQRVYQFNFLISQCHHTMRAHCIYTKQLCAASASSSCIVTTADASAGGNNSCTYLFLFLSPFFYSPFFPSVPFSFLLPYTYSKII